MVRLISFFGFLYMFSLTAYAAPTSDEGTLFDEFNINQEQIAIDAHEESFGLYSTNEDNKIELMDDEDLKLNDINDFGIFSLSKGFSRLSMATFSDTKSITGKGDYNSLIGFAVFSLSEDQKMIVNDSGYKKIGITGIFNEQVKFQIGTNYVLIAVKNEGFFAYRLLKVVVKQEETKGLLENIEVNFIPTIQEVKPVEPSNPLTFSTSYLSGLK